MNATLKQSQQLQDKAQRTLVESHKIIASTKEIDCKDFVIKFDLTKHPNYAQDVEFKVELTPVRKEVYSICIILMFDAVYNLTDQIYYKSMQGLNPNASKQMANMYRARISELLRKDSEDKVKDFGLLQFIDRNLTRFNKNECIRKLKLDDNKQPYIKVDYDVLCNEIPQFKEEYKDSESLIDKELMKYLESAYYAAQKVINTNNDKIKSLIKK